MHYPYKHPKAITMWDFSWLERRWPGAGYEDWAQALDELAQRGYDAIRIDAYPHLLAADPTREWTLKPAWNQQVWGAPALTRINHIQKNLIDFLSLCKARGFAVALSSWFREDTDNLRMRITTPDALAQIWICVLDAVRDAGLLDTILYVDLCNEFALRDWSPFLYLDAEYRALAAAGQIEANRNLPRTSPIVTRWLNRATALLREAYPMLDYTFSQSDGSYDDAADADVSALDLLEPHLWMSSYTQFYEQVGYNYERFDSKGYDALALYAEPLYHSDAAYWDGKLCEGIAKLANWSRSVKKPLITTECWGIVDYKDWPLLSWDWVKHLCALGVKQAAAEGRWLAIATSNFCGPQFVGMWRDIDWHRQLTTLIKQAALPDEAISD